MEILYAAIGLAVLIGLYLWSYQLNEKCEKPEGAEEPGCTTCSSRSCTSRQNEFKE